MTAFTDVLRTLAELIDTRELPGEVHIDTSTVYVHATEESDVDLWRKVLGGTWTREVITGYYATRSNDAPILPSGWWVTIFTPAPIPAAPLKAVA